MAPNRDGLDPNREGQAARIKRPPTEAASFYMNKAIATIAMGLSPSATMSALKGRSLLMTQPLRLGLKSYS